MAAEKGAKALLATVSWCEQKYADALRATSQKHRCCVSVVKATAESEFNSRTELRREFEDTDSPTACSAAQ